MLLVFTMALVFFQIFNAWPLFLKEIYRLPENRIGFLLALNAVIIVITEMPLVHALEKKDAWRIIAPGVLLLICGFSLTALSSNYFVLLFTVVIWTTGEMMVFPLLGSVVANRAPEHRQGSYMGVFSLTFSLAFVVGPGLGMWIYESFGPYALWSGVFITGILLTLALYYAGHLMTKHLLPTDADVNEKAKF
ncbi:MAG: MFS transporter [Calditrichia bacterium]